MTVRAIDNLLRLLLTLVAGAAMLALAGCSGNSALSGSPVPKTGEFTQTGVANGNRLSPSTAASMDKIFAAKDGAAAVGQEYRIAAMDVLEISVLGVPDLSRTVQVSSAGTISLPLIKQVQASGKTTERLERDIAAKLQQTYLQSPQVSVFVKEFNSQKITVDGAVKKPGIFPITGRTSLLQAIALAEGLNEVADPSGVLVFRVVNNKRMAARFDVKKVRSGQISDPVLQAGDIVMVDESSGRTTLRDVKNVLPLTGLFNLLLM